MPDAKHHPIVLALILTSTALSLAGTDLVLPAVPGLPRSLGGSLEQAQLVLAAFSGGAAAGLLIFGELGARWDPRRLLVASLACYGLVSALCSVSPSLPVLIWLRGMQGASGAAAAVFAPGMLRALYGDARAVSALGMLGSVESLTPALAPVAGVWLLNQFGWHASFITLAVFSALLAAAFWLVRGHLPAAQAPRARGSYGRLLRRWAFMRQALSQAFTLGALLVFVLGAPTVFTTSLHGTLRDFIVMQVSGIATFIVAANLTGTLSRRVGALTMIRAETLLSAMAAATLVAYALAGGTHILTVTVIFVCLNTGLGLRAPPGFHAALVASEDDNARGAALVMVLIFLTTALATAAAAPFIARGLIAIALPASVLSLTAFTLLVSDSSRTLARRMPQQQHSP